MPTISEAIEGIRTLQQSYDALATTVTEWTQGVPQRAVLNDVTDITISPNTLYIFVNRTADIDIELEPGSADYTNEYHFVIHVGESIPTVTLPTSVDFGFDINDNVMKVNKTYEFSILDNQGIMVGWQ